MTSTALVLGGQTGLLGQALVRTLNKHGFSVHTLGRADGDLQDRDFLSSQLAKIAPDFLFNTIAYTQVDKAEQDKAEALLWNRTLPDTLGRLVKESATHLIQFSTDFVFAGNKGSAYVETDATRPLSVYGSSKLAGEQALLQLNLPNCCIIRTAWLFGPGRSNFITTILEACRKRDTISVIHDHMGSPTYSLDLAHWSMLLAQKKIPGIFHAVNNGTASWCELACEAVNLSESHCRVEAIPAAQWPQAAPRPIFSVLNTDKLTQAIGIKPRPWPQALRDYLYSEYLKNNKTPC
ncbi:MAG: dTDP-4-dehydrorhamnose reductase [Desulfovibrionaceae bacterium]